MTKQDKACLCNAAGTNSFFSRWPWEYLGQSSHQAFGNPQNLAASALKKWLRLSNNDNMKNDYSTTFWKAQDF